MGTAEVSRSGARWLLLALTTLVAIVCTAAPARADDGSLLGCGYEATHPFLPWLDPLPYTLAPGGDFESGSGGWSLSGGARIVDGNEPFSSGAHSLLLPPSSSATSAPTCMGLVLPVVRFFSTGGAALSYLQVDALYTDTSGTQRSVTLLPIGLPSKSWIPNLPMLQLGGAVSALSLNGLTTEISLRFTPRGLLFGSGTWRIDDVYFDPWKRI